MIDTTPPRTYKDRLYLLYGLTVRSAVSLPAQAGRACEDGRATPDHIITWGASHTVTADPPPGQIITRHCLTDTVGSTLTQGDGRYIYRIHGVLDFFISGDLRRISIHLTPGGDQDLVPVFITSTLMAMLLALNGEITLHASAVAMDGRALAVAGPSGSGKSTLAALLCRIPGAQFVTDDLLRLECAGDELLCIPGVPDIRLRPAAAELAQGVSKDAGRVSADQRTVLRPPRIAESPVPLHAIVLPRPRRDGRPMRIARLTGSRAVFGMAQCPRTWPWTHQNNLGQQFQWFAALVRAPIAIYEVDLPWGPPFDPSIADALAKLITAATLPQAPRRGDSASHDVSRETCFT